MQRETEVSRRGSPRACVREATYPELLFLGRSLLHLLLLTLLGLVIECEFSSQEPSRAHPESFISDTTDDEDVRGRLPTTHLCSRHLCKNSSLTFLKTVTLNNVYSSSLVISLRAGVNNGTSSRVRGTDSRAAPRYDHRGESFILFLPVAYEVAVVRRSLAIDLVVTTTA